MFILALLKTMENWLEIANLKNSSKMALDLVKSSRGEY